MSGASRTALWSSAWCSCLWYSKAVCTELLCARHGARNFTWLVMVNALYQPVSKGLLFGLTCEETEAQEVSLFIYLSSRARVQSPAVVFTATLFVLILPEALIY